MSLRSLMRNMYLLTDTQQPPLDDSMMDKWTTWKQVWGECMSAECVCDTLSCVLPPSVQPRISIKPIKRVCSTRQLPSIMDVEHLSEALCISLCALRPRLLDHPGSMDIICIVKGKFI